MTERIITCIECPIGCTITVGLDGDKIINLEGNTCQRGKLYAENEIVCPRRVLTSTVKTMDGRLLAVKTIRPIKKSETFKVLEIIRNTVTQVKHIGEVVVKNVSEDIDLVSAQELDVEYSRTKF